MRVASIIGARPQFIKIAPLLRAIESHNDQGDDSIASVIINTGQHYDPGMSAIFFEELRLPPATYDLAVGSGPHGQQTGRMLEKIEQALLEIRPDMVVTYGDTNSTLAGTLAATKLHIPVAHIEAGLRSFNRAMPEEINRVAADHLSDLLLAPTPAAIKNLANEGLSEKACFSGDIMYDAVLFNRELAVQRSGILQRLALEPGSYGLVTVHRAENTDDDKRLGDLLEAFNELAADGLPLIFPIHPRTAQRIASRIPSWAAHSRLYVLEPLGYWDMLALTSSAKVILTDSGGLQKEAFFLGCPCVTLRAETEWIETIEGGGNVVVGADKDKLYSAVSHWEKRFPTGQADFSQAAQAAFGNGTAANTILSALLTFYCNRGQRRMASCEGFI